MCVCVFVFLYIYIYIYICMYICMYIYIIKRLSSASPGLTGGLLLSVVCTAQQVGAARPRVLPFGLLPCCFSGPVSSRVLRLDVFRVSHVFFITLKPRVD